MVLKLAATIALSMKRKPMRPALGNRKGHITKAVWEDLPGPPSQCIIAANAHTPMETRSPGCGSSAGQTVGS